MQENSPGKRHNKGVAVRKGMCSEIYENVSVLTLKLKEQVRARLRRFLNTKSMSLDFILEKIRN